MLWFYCLGIPQVLVIVVDVETQIDEFQRILATRIYLSRYTGVPESKPHLSVVFWLYGFGNFLQRTLGSSEATVM